jgi:NAD(P)-dependent dehydrogenase (short-subunit alcohol dehydrogenase family)
VGADVSTASGIATLFKEMKAAFGRVDILINKAGVYAFGRWNLSQPKCGIGNSISMYWVCCSLRKPLSCFSLKRAGVS